MKTLNTRQAICLSLLFTSIWTNAAILPTGLAGWWSGDSHANDVSGNNNHGAPTGITYVSGKIASGFNFNGTSSFITASASPSLNVSSFTFAAWVKPADNNWRPVIEYGNDDAWSGVCLWIKPSSTANADLLFNVRETTFNGNPSPEWYITAADCVPIGTWSFVVATFDHSSKSAKLYVNGIQKTASNLNVITPKTNVRLNIGQRAPTSWDALGGQKFSGTMDEVKIYYRALSGQEILDIYESPSAVPCCIIPPPGLAGWWRGHNDATDKSGNNNNGTPTSIGYVAAKVTSGFNFDGTSSKITVAPSETLHVTNLTFTAWVKPTENGWRPVIEYGADNDWSGVCLWIAESSTQNADLLFNVRDVSFGGDPSYEQYTLAQNVIPINEWSFLTATFNRASGLASLYVNGVLVRIQILNVQHPKTNVRLNIGYRSATSSDALKGKSFLGIIDEPDVYSRVLTPGEVAAIYMAGSQGKCVPDGNSRPMAKLRIAGVQDVGRVLVRGQGPSSSDVRGVREASISHFDEIPGNPPKYYLFYDGVSSQDQWRACLATSTDLVNWTRHGPKLQPVSGTGFAGAAVSPWSIKDQATGLWHLFYAGAANLGVPGFPYNTYRAMSGSGTFNENTVWNQTNSAQIIPRNQNNPSHAWYAADSVNSAVVPGDMLIHSNKYVQFVSLQGYDGPKLLRTIGIAETPVSAITTPWTVIKDQIVPREEQIENTSLYYENNIYYLFVNHVGDYEGTSEYTDAIWVYWSTNLSSWNPANKAIVLDGSNCTWSKRIIGMATVVKPPNQTGQERLAIFYDGNIDWSQTGHYDRDIGLAWLNLPIVIPTN